MSSQYSQFAALLDGETFADVVAKLMHDHEVRLQELHGEYKERLAYQRERYEEDLALKDQEIKRLKFKSDFDSILSKGLSEESSDAPEGGSTDRSDSATTSTQSEFDVAVDLNEESDAAFVPYRRRGPVGSRYQGRSRPSGQGEYSQHKGDFFRYTPNGGYHISIGSGNTTGNYMSNVGNTTNTYFTAGSNGTGASPGVTDYMRRGS